MDIGKRIRDLRRVKDITLIDLADKTGVAQATLSRIETGVMTGTVESHMKIAHALGMTLSELYSGLDSPEKEAVHTPKSKIEPVSAGSKVRKELLTDNISNKKMAPILITLRADAETAPKTDEIGTEKILFVLQGTITAKLRDIEHKLKSHETLYFDSSLPYKLINNSGKEAKILAVTSPAAI